MGTSNVKLSKMDKIPLFWLLLILWSASGVVTQHENIWLFSGTTTRECRVAGSSKTSIDVPSLLRCGVRTKIYGATEFDYNDQMCEIYGGYHKISLMTIEYERVMSLDVLEEVALGKQVYSSAPLSNNANLAREANDGDEVTYFSSVALRNPFWLVDLGEVRTVHRVRINPNGNGCMYCKVWIGMDLVTSGDFSSYTLFANFGYTGLNPGNITCYSLGVPGRYLGLQRIHPNPSLISVLGIREVKVYASYMP